VPNDVGGFVYLPKMAAMVVLCNSLAPSNQYTTSLDSNCRTGACSAEQHGIIEAILSQRRQERKGKRK